MSENEMNSEQPIVSLKDVHKSFGDLAVSYTHLTLPTT